MQYHWRVLAVFILVLLPMCLIINSWSSNIGANLLSEMIGAFVATIVIDYITERRSAERSQEQELPMRFTRYQDLVSWIDGIAATWNAMYHAAVADRPPTASAEFFAAATLTSIVDLLDVETAVPDRSNAIPWYLYLSQDATGCISAGQAILSRHGPQLDPVVYEKVYLVTEGVLMDGLGQLAFHAEHAKNHWPQTSLLREYVPVDSLSDQLEALRHIYDYCVQEHEALGVLIEQRRLGVPEYVLRKPFPLDYGSHHPGLLPSRMSPEKLHDQQAAIEAEQRRMEGGEPRA